MVDPPPLQQLQDGQRPPLPRPSAPQSSLNPSLSSQQRNSSSLQPSASNSSFNFAAAVTGAGSRPSAATVTPLQPTHQQQQTTTSIQQPTVPNSAQTTTQSAAVSATVSAAATAAAAAVSPMNSAAPAGLDTPTATMTLSQSQPRKPCSIRTPTATPSSIRTPTPEIQPFRDADFPPLPPPRISATPATLPSPSDPSTSTPPSASPPLAYREAILHETANSTPDFSTLLKIGLRENKPEIQIPDVLFNRILDSYKFSLIGRLDLQLITYDEAIRQLKQQWCLKGAIRCTSLGKGYISFQLEKEEDMKKIRLSKPWFVVYTDKHEKKHNLFLRVREWIPCFSPEKQVQTNAMAWVHLPGLPLEYWDRDILFGIGRGLGIPIQVSRTTMERKYGSYAKILVDIDFAKKVPNQVWIGHENRSGFWQDVTIPVEPEFCTQCNIIGHTVKNCRILKAIQDGTTTEKRPRKASKLGNQLDAAGPSSAAITITEDIPNIQPPLLDLPTTNNGVSITAPEIGLNAENRVLISPNSFELLADDTRDMAAVLEPIEDLEPIVNFNQIPGITNIEARNSTIKFTTEQLLARGKEWKRKVATSEKGTADTVGIPLSIAAHLEGQEDLIARQVTVVFDSDNSEETEGRGGQFESLEDGEVSQPQLTFTEPSKESLLQLEAEQRLITVPDLTIQPKKHKRKKKIVFEGELPPGDHIDSDDGVEKDTLNDDLVAFHPPIDDSLVQKLRGKKHCSSDLVDETVTSFSRTLEIDEVEEDELGQADQRGAKDNSSDLTGHLERTSHSERLNTKDGKKNRKRSKSAVKSRDGRLRIDEEPSNDHISSKASKKKGNIKGSSKDSSDLGIHANTKPDAK